MPDTLNRSRAFGSTMLGWAGRARSDTLQVNRAAESRELRDARANIEPQPRADQCERVGVPRTPVNVAPAWEGPHDATSVGFHGGELASVARPPPGMGRRRDHADPVGRATARPRHEAVRASSSHRRPTHGGCCRIESVAARTSIAGTEGHEPAAAARLHATDEAGGPDRPAAAGDAEADGSGDAACVADAQPERRRGAPPRGDARAIAVGVARGWPRARSSI